MAGSEVTRVRFNSQTGDCEIEGSEDFVRDMFSQLKELLARATPPAKPVRKESIPPVELGSSNLPVPDNFGEFFHQFSPKTDADRMLIAGQFAQQQSEDSTFTTGAANALLTAQGIKLSNPSNSLKQAAAGKRVFKHGKGWRISKTGSEHISSLSGDKNAG